MCDSYLLYYLLCYYYYYHHDLFLSLAVFASALCVCLLSLCFVCDIIETAARLHCMGQQSLEEETLCSCGHRHQVQLPRWHHLCSSH